MVIIGGTGPGPDGSSLTPNYRRLRDCRVEKRYGKLESGFRDNPCGQTLYLFFFGRHPVIISSEKS
jgi:hypothetical protein